MITAFIMGILVAIATMAVITVSVITAKWVIKKVKERQAANEEDGDVIFADLREIIDSNIKEQKNNQKEYPMDELEKLCQEAPYIFADYDKDTEKISNYTGIKAEKIDEDVKSRLKKVGGLVVLN